MQAPYVPMIPLGVKPERKPQAPAPTTATLYVRNLNEKLQEKTITTALDAIFSQFGKIVDIRYKRNLRHRGQAFVSFESIAVASEALQKAQGFPLFDKPMDVQFAREPAYAVTQLDGDEKLATQKRIREEQQGCHLHLKHSAKKGDGRRRSKKAKNKMYCPIAHSAAGDDHLPPNCILFLQNLPDNVNEQTLAAMFNQYSISNLDSPDLKKCDWFLEKQILVFCCLMAAFVEYDTDGEAVTAKQSLHGYRMFDKEIKVTYARK